ncbi:NAD(P)/FAD-dependent oxidoreductase [Sphingomonas sp.]|uniref:flavin-containing monooxygenase n=1 Tax=Sphingomonas sp. TaxID=28214 RepID=UPI002CCB4C2F|nr:NAD(P)/FAD-dependent oxidoreductase [Sphingomonas sp.]HWK35428.1 NAD(P)/FAD-dependent oxidoreductase [Sphingomonas sp.]
MSARSFDVVIVGAGFAGLYALHKFRGMGKSVAVLETAADVGGTWYWNRYPGARCDAQSMLYSFSFDEGIEQEWTWTERYATQPEILRYLNFVADRLDLRRDIRFGATVTGARFDTATDRWSVRTADGAEYDARYLIMGTGALSVGRMPDIAGIEQFAGESYHTGNWPHDGVDLAGKRIGIIGTGSSGVQTIPLAAQVAGHLTVFQRTPAYVAPAMNAPHSEAQVAEFKDNAGTLRARARVGDLRGIGELFAPWLPPKGRTAMSVSAEERAEVYERCWNIGGAVIMTAFSDLMTDEAANSTAADFFAHKIREIVTDPVTAERLIPRDYPVFSKRLAIGTDYYETFNRPNVTLVDAAAHPIVEVTAEGIRTSERDYPLDVIVYATGFDAMTGALTAIDIQGVDHRTIANVWREGPRTYLGVAMANFPNLFTVTGPGSPSVLSNVVVSIEQHVEWIAALIAHADARGATRIEAEAEAQDRWVDRVNAAAAGTLFLKGKSWYLGANVPGKARVFMPFIGGVGPYRAICDEIAEAGYPGFALSGNATAEAAA